MHESTQNQILLGGMVNVMEKAFCNFLKGEKGRET